VSFWILWGADVIAALIAVYFFFVGLGDGSVSSFNAGIWALLLGALATVVLGSLWLRGAGHPRLAQALVTALGVPAIGTGLFFAVLLISKPRWN
jgi:hypothetical protein